MGNSASSEFRRRYAYPGEIPTPVLAPKPTAFEPKPPVLAPKPTAFAPKPNEVRLAMGPELERKNVNSPAWKDAIGTKKVPARFELLPEAKPRWDRISLSAGGQLAILGVLLLLPQIFPEQMKTALKFNGVELMRPITEIPLAPPPRPRPPKIRAKVPPPEPKPIEPEPVKLNPKQPHVFLVTKPEARTARTVEAKPVELNPVLEQVKIDIPTSQPKRPKDDVNVGALGSGSPAPATLVAAVNKVQTGGFGDPTGIAGPGNPNRAANINQSGSPLLPGGRANGNGSGGANGARGTVAVAAKKQASTGAGGNSQVNILEKPNPVYTAEGRTLRIEGDVVLEVVFLASGQVQVNRVVSGLAHGLNEAAIQAAKQIRFKPATRDGQPVDFPARVRIAFRVAS